MGWRSTTASPWSVRAINHNIQFPGTNLFFLKSRSINKFYMYRTTTIFGGQEFFLTKNLFADFDQF